MSGLKGRFLDQNGVTDDKVRLRNNQPLRARNAAGTGDVDVAKVDASNIVQLLTQTQIAFTPSAANDLSSKGYVDTQVAGVTFTAGNGLQTLTGVTSVKSADTSVGVSSSGVQVALNVSSGLQVSSGLKVLAADTSVGVSSSGVQVALGTNSGLQISSGLKIQAADTSVNLSGTGVKVALATSSALSVSSGLLVVVDGVTLKINGSNQLEGLKDAQDVFVLTGTDITNGYVNLTQLAASNSVQVFIRGVLQRPTSDYTLSTVAGVTRVTFAGDLLAAIATDVLMVQYRYL